MTVEQALRIVRDRQARVGAAPAAQPMDWQELAVAADVLATATFALERELARERARAGWPVLCTSPSRVRPRNERPADRMWLDDAVNVARNAVEDGIARGGPPPQLLEAATALVVYIEESETDLARERSRVEAAARADAPRVEGAPIVSGRDGGGRRDFLSGEPIHAGATLFLLTWKGWMAVRYESNGADGPSLIYLSLPGVNAEVSFAIPADARFAWPDDVKPAGD